MNSFKAKGDFECPVYWFLKPRWLKLAVKNVSDIDFNYDAPNSDKHYEKIDVSYSDISIDITSSNLTLSKLDNVYYQDNSVNVVDICNNTGTINFKTYISDNEKFNKINVLKNFKSYLPSEKSYLNKKQDEEYFEITNEFINLPLNKIVKTKYDKDISLNLFLDDKRRYKILLYKNKSVPLSDISVKGSDNNFNIEEVKEVYYNKKKYTFIKPNESHKKSKSLQLIDKSKQVVKLQEDSKEKIYKIHLTLTLLDKSTPITLSRKILNKDCDTSCKTIDKTLTDI